MIELGERFIAFQRNSLCQLTFRFLFVLLNNNTIEYCMTFVFKTNVCRAAMSPGSLSSFYMWFSLYEHGAYSHICLKFALIFVLYIEIQYKMMLRLSR